VGNAAVTGPTTLPEKDKDCISSSLQSPILPSLRFHKLSRPGPFLSPLRTMEAKMSHERIEKRTSGGVESGFAQEDQRHVRKVVLKMDVRYVANSCHLKRKS
jgi:hypothetical protein